MYDDIMPNEARRDGGAGGRAQERATYGAHVYRERDDYIFEVGSAVVRVGDDYAEAAEYMTPLRSAKGQLGFGASAIRRVFLNLITALRGADDNNVCRMDLHVENGVGFDRVERCDGDGFRSCAVQGCSVRHDDDKDLRFLGRVAAPELKEVYTTRYSREICSLPESMQRRVEAKYISEFRRAFDYDRQTLWTVASPCVYDVWRGVFLRAFRAVGRSCVSRPGCR